MRDGIGASCLEPDCEGSFVVNARQDDGGMFLDLLSLDVHRRQRMVLSVECFGQWRVMCAVGNVASGNHSRSTDRCESTPRSRSSLDRHSDASHVLFDVTTGSVATFRNSKYLEPLLDAESAAER